MSTILKVEDINVYYGSIHAIKDISFEVNEGEIVTLIGANGAGKSSTLNTIAGLLRSKTGSIMFNGENISHTPAYKIVGKGIAMVPEGRRIFQQMTVRENLDMGAYTGSSAIDAKLEAVYSQFPRLKEREKQVAGTLSGGEFEIIAAFHKQGTTILLVEQNAQAALSIADRGYVLETGRIVTSGTGTELLNSTAIKKAYLGG